MYQISEDHKGNFLEKKIKKSKIFFSMNVNCFNLAKIFVLRLFKMVANQTDCSTLEQRSVIKF